MRAAPKTTLIEGVTSRLARPWAGLLDLLFPPQCARCRTPLEETPRGPAFCHRCRNLLVDLVPTCARCGLGVGAADALPDGCVQCRRGWRLDALACLSRYDEALRELVLRTKHAADPGLSAAAAELLWERRGETLRGYAVDAVVPAPVHWLRRLQTGGNHAELIAVRLARLLRAPLPKGLLRRIANPPKQALLPAHKRRANVRGAFAAAPVLRGARLLVVDDVVTTGATLNEAARVLKAAGAAAVFGAALARGNPREA